MADAEMKAEEVKEETKEEEKEEAKEDVDMKEEGKEEGEAAAEEAPKEPEKPKELEVDAADDSRPKVAAGAVDINASDTTLNAMPTADNRLLMALSDGGFQHLLAGARCNSGITGGRYMFEARIIESPGGKDQGGKAPQPRNVLRVGLSLTGSSLLLGDGGAESICFDSEGFLYFGRSRKKVCSRFGRDSTVAVLVNLDAASAHPNTISLFKDGARASQPQAIPEALLGKPLFPTITYRNVTTMVNFGPQPFVPLPFTCRMVGDAAAADVQVKKAAAPAGGKYEVVFPVGLPSAGYFDWVDDFLDKNPDYVELSDRKIVEWAVKSGMYRPKGPGHSNDKPDMKFGIPAMDDNSVARLLKHIAPVAKRNFVVPELKANLVAADRKKALARFSTPHFKKTAHVFVGEPSAEFKARVQDLILRDKKRKAEELARRKKAEEDRAKALAAKKKKAEEKKAGKAGEAKEGDAEAEEEKADETKMDEDVVVELTDEEKALTFRKTYNPDVTEAVLSKSFTGFSIPTKEEGFDSITFSWDSEAAAEKTMKDWVFSKKLTQRVEDLKIGDSFKESWTAFTKQLSEWKKLAGEWKDPTKRKALLEKRAAAKKKEAEEKGDEAAAAEAAKEPEIDLEELDVFAVENIDDIGNGMPLYADFAYEDWTLLSTRYEVHLLLHSFKKDLNDADRPSFAEKDLAFYYSKYFKKNFNVKFFGFEKLSQLQDLIKDTFVVNEKSTFLEAQLPDDTALAQFVKLTEDHRRERTRRLDAGDETAEIKFPRGMANAKGSSGAAGGGKSGSWGSGGKSSSKGSKGAGKSEGKGKGKSSKGASKGSKGGGKSAAPALGAASGYRSAAPQSRYSGSGTFSSGAAAAPRGGYSSAIPAKRSYPTAAGGGSYGSNKFARGGGSYSGGGGGGNYGGYGRR